MSGGKHPSGGVPPTRPSKEGAGPHLSRPRRQSNEAILLKQTEEALRASEARLRRSQELGGAHPYEWDIATNKLLAYSGLGKLYGLGADEPVTYEAVTSRIHPDDRAKVRAAHQVALSTGGPYAQEYRVVLPDGMVRWVLARGEAVLTEDGSTRALAGVVVDITERKQAEMALREREAELRDREALLRSIFQSEGVFTAVLELTDDDAVYVMANERTAQFFRMSAGQLVGKRLSDLGLTGEELRTWLTFLSDCYAKNKPTTLEYPFEANGQRLYCLGTFTPLPQGRSTRPRLSLVTLDITERKRLEDQQSLVSRELHHRVKNSLATVQAVISSTARTAQSITEFRNAVTERITSLSRTHTLLIESGYGGASLRDILLAELTPYDDPIQHRVKLDGPDVDLPSEMAVAVGMAVHELTTNAAKYGAFSLPSGSVHVRWELASDSDQQQLLLEWQEKDGPPVQPPQTQGFGTVLLNRALGRQLGGEVNTDFAAEGLKVVIKAVIRASTDSHRS